MLFCLNCVKIIGDNGLVYIIVVESTVFKFFMMLNRSGFTYNIIKLRKGEEKMKKVLISVLLIITLIMSTMTTLAATPAKAANEVVIYVSPDGDDSASGTINDPIATFEAAINKVRQMDKTKPVTVIFREGTYNVDSTIYMDARDSGTEKAPITYKAYEGETPVFTHSLLLQRKTGKNGMAHALL